MRTTLALDDDLLAQAEALTGVGEKTALVREALKASSGSRRVGWRGWAVATGGRRRRGGGVVFPGDG